MILGDAVRLHPGVAHDFLIAEPALGVESQQALDEVLL